MKSLRLKLRVLILVLVVVSPTLATDYFQLESSFDENLETDFASMTGLSSFDNTYLAKTSSGDDLGKDSLIMQTRSLADKIEYLDEMGNKIGKFTPDILHDTSVRKDIPDYDESKNAISVICTIAGKLTTLIDYLVCPDRSSTQFRYFTKNSAGFATLSAVQHPLVQSTQNTAFESIAN